MPPDGSFDLPEALQLLLAAIHDPPFWLLPGLLRESVLCPKMSALISLPSTSRFSRQSLQKGASSVKPTGQKKRQGSSLELHHHIYNNNNI
jgi:hypothetical protein